MLTLWGIRPVNSHELRKLLFHKGSRDAGTVARAMRHVPKRSDQCHQNRSEPFSTASNVSGLPVPFRQHVWPPRDRAQCLDTHTPIDQSILAQLVIIQPPTPVDPNLRIPKGQQFYH